jgi:ParB/RepB/Spo0J family partition protein
MNKTTIEVIAMEKLAVSDANVRKQVTDKHRLKESISKEGVLEPIHVWKNQESGIYEIMQGQHRYHGALDAKLKELECIIHLNIQSLEDAKKWCRKQVCLQEDLGPLDKAQIAIDLEHEYGSLLEGCKQENLSYTKLSDWFSLRKLCPEVRQAIAQPEISDGPKLDLSFKDLKEISRFSQDRQMEVAKSIQGKTEVEKRICLKELKGENSSIPVLVEVTFEVYQTMKQKAAEKSLRIEQYCSEILEKELKQE